MSYEGSPDYVRAARVIYYGFVLAMVGVMIHLQSKPKTPQPPRSKAIGCYTTLDAEPILLDKQGMTILQRVPIRMGYHLERHKNGIALVAEAPLAAEWDGTRYVFSIQPPGDGLFLNFFNVIDGHTYGVFDENQLKQFTMLAGDGKYLPFRKGPPNFCRT